jgi:hypothetical protein
LASEVNYKVGGRKESQEIVKTNQKRIVRSLALLLSLLCLTVICTLPLSAKDGLAQPRVLTNPNVNEPVHFDVSPPLSDLAKQVLPWYRFHLAEAEPVLLPKAQLLMKGEQTNRRPFVDEAQQRYSGPNVSASVGVNVLGVGHGFLGYTVPDAPTDVNLAVGDTQVVQWANVSYAVFDKTSGAVVAGPIEGNQFWAGFGGPCENDNDGDIIVQWDKIAHRWLMSQNVFTGPPYYTCVAVSQTADATGKYYRYQFSQPGFPDYPKWGVWPDAYYQSQNDFSDGSKYVGVTVCAYQRTKMLNGLKAKQICFVDSSNGTFFDDSMLPADLDSAHHLPSKGAPEVYVGSIDNGTGGNGNNLYEYLFHVDFAQPNKSTFSGVNGAMPIKVAAFHLACGGFAACIPQEGIGDQLDSLGDRLMYRLAYRNFGSHQTWLVSHSVTSEGGQVGERWYEFRAPARSTALKVHQQGTFAPDGNDRWMGSIAMDKVGDIALGYSVSSSSMYPSINFTGRVPTDSKNTMETEAQIVAGTGSQIGTSNRWGDYTSMAIDEQDDCTFWYSNQWYMATASFNWSTQVASLKFPNCQ